MLRRTGQDPGIKHFHKEMSGAWLDRGAKTLSIDANVLHIYQLAWSCSSPAIRLELSGLTRPGVVMKELY